MRKQNANAYQLGMVPAGQSPMLGTWKEKIWSGTIEIRSDAPFTTVELISADGTLFGRAKVPQDFSSSVIKCSDSSRGYALKLTHDDGRSAWIGLAFHDRNDAFDFYSSFDESLKRQKDATRGEIKVDADLMRRLKTGVKTRVGFSKGSCDPNEQLGR